MSSSCSTCARSKGAASAARIRGGSCARRSRSRGALAGATARPARRSLRRRLRGRARSGSPVASARVPLAILEPDRVLGLANRWLAPFARRAYVSFAETESQASARQSRFAPASRFVARSGRAPTCRRSERFRVLVLGGSSGGQGAERRGAARSGRGRAAGAHPFDRPSGGPRSRRRSGPQAYEQLGARCARRGGPIHRRCRGRAGSAADLFIGRAGGGSVAELCAVGRPSILVPLPHAPTTTNEKTPKRSRGPGATVCLAQSEPRHDSRPKCSPSCRAMSDGSNGRRRPRASAGPKRRASRAICSSSPASRAGRAPLASRRRARRRTATPRARANAPSRRLPMFRGRVRHVHFVGIGGIGMSGIAEILRTLGFDVSGSDLKENDITRRLADAGRAHRRRAPRGERRAAPTWWSISSAITPDNPEVVEARARGIPVIPRAEMLAELMRLKYGVAIAGSHGKTTTTSLVATVLRAAGLDPTVVIGGKLHALGSNARLGAGRPAGRRGRRVRRLVPAAHADDRGRHQHRPRAPRSLRHARRRQGGVRRVRQQRAVLRPGGAVPRSPARAGRSCPQVARRHVTYGISRAGRLPRASDPLRRASTRTSRPIRRGEALGEFTRAACRARTTCSTALAVIAVADELEVPLDVTKQALADLRRRGAALHRRRRAATASPCVDDYGHHPAEIGATLDARAARLRPARRRRVPAAPLHPHARSLRRVRARLQRGRRRDRHRHLRRRRGADPGRHRASALAQAIREHGHHDVDATSPTSARFAESSSEACQPGDVVIALGAGDINAVGA